MYAARQTKLLTHQGNSFKRLLKSDWRFSRKPSFIANEEMSQLSPTYWAVTSLFQKFETKH